VALIRRWRRYDPPKRRFLKEPHGVISQKMIIIIITAVETSNLTIYGLFVLNCSFLVRYPTNLLISESEVLHY
jgi:hypothetical protein